MNLFLHEGGWQRVQVQAAKAEVGSVCVRVRCRVAALQGASQGALPLARRQVIKEAF